MATAYAHSGLRLVSWWERWKVTRSILPLSRQYLPRMSLDQSIARPRVVKIRAMLRDDVQMTT